MNQMDLITSECIFVLGLYEYLDIFLDNIDTFKRSFLPHSRCLQNGLNFMFNICYNGNLEFVKYIFDEVILLEEDLKHDIESYSEMVNYLLSIIDKKIDSFIRLAVLNIRTYKFQMYKFVAKYLQMDIWDNTHVEHFCNIKDFRSVCPFEKGLKT
jgi:hypothetical protein